MNPSPAPPAGPPRLLLVEDDPVSAAFLREAEAALRVAEAAYRFGERGILDWLDAQRTYRAARNELISARYDLATVSVEIDRLRSIASDIVVPTSSTENNTLPGLR